ncbi:hypothetical protein [Agromyces sp. Marseille-Q5079]|uniref:hypothetical protein n=1 Tax=Agromyces sp. Marseille-Q5079 TaxID=3439059 RepID=UPI003D9CA800
MPRRTRGGSVLALAVALALAGCAAPASAPTESGSSAPTPGAESTPSPEPTPSAEPVEPLAGVVAMVVRPQVLELRDADGEVVDSLDYLSDPSAAVAVLTDLFDAPPADESYDGTNHTPPGVFHAWDDLVLDERFYDEERRDSEGQEYVWPRFAVYFDGPSVRGLDLASEQGFHATDPWASLAGDPVFDAALWTCVGTPIETLEYAGVDGRLETATVVATPSDDGSTVKWLGAPVMVADGCA